MKGKFFIALALIVLSVRFGWSQSLQYTERLPLGRNYVGDNMLHLEVTTPERPYSYSYTFPNMIARLDRGLAQCILAIPAIEPDLADPTVLNNTTPEEQEFLARLIYVNRANPIIIRLLFPPGIIDLDQLSDAPLLTGSEVQMGGRTYNTTARVQGLYQDDQLLLSFSLVIDNTIMGIARQAVEDIQLYAQGVRLAGVRGNP